MSDLGSSHLAQVLDVIREILLEHMDSPQALQEYRIEDVLQIDRETGAPIDDASVIAGRACPGALRLMMRDGSVLRLSLESEARTTNAD